MFKLLITNTKYDRHTAKIGQRITKTARDADCAAELCDMACMQPNRTLGAYDGVIAGGPAFLLVERGRNTMVSCSWVIHSKVNCPRNCSCEQHAANSDYKSRE